MDVVSQYQMWYEKHKKKVLEDYFAFLRLPSISTDAAYKKDIDKTALWLKGYLEFIGLKVDVWETSGNPVVFASHFVDASFPTLLIYHHYDVQPIDPLEEWRSSPFDPVILNEKVYARGASDNKGQCFYTLMALQSFFEIYGDRNLNIKLFIEGEEECGSKGSQEVIQQRREELKADFVVVVDGYMLSMDDPVITSGLRGMVSLEVTYTNASIDLHSGMYGGVVLNPARVLVQMLGQLWDAGGRVVLDGFYDGIDINQRIEGEIDQPYLEQHFGVKVFQGEAGFSLLESNTIRPTLEINGLYSGYTGKGGKTIIPSKASVKISCRLVPGQEPAVISRILSDYFKKQAPVGIEVDVRLSQGSKAVVTSFDTKMASICLEAFTEVLKKPCRPTLSGASIPIVPKLVEVSGGEMIIMGVGLDSDNIHSPNECFGLNQLNTGFLIMGTILKKLAV
jgi:acetylornithine deacetylase/succinyl-diaminopimelate desuccinylase-like protein